LQGSQTSRMVMG